MMNKQEESKTYSNLTEGEQWLREREIKDKQAKGCTIKFLYFIIFCIFIFIMGLAATDAPSPLDTYPFQSTMFYLLTGGENDHLD